MRFKRVLIPYRNATKAERYAAAMRQAGVEPILVAADAPGIPELPEGLLLAGGTDVDPQLYGQHRGPHTHEPDAPRDRLEIELLRRALTDDRPVLAICRGLQLMNVAHHGGTLVQHVEGHLVRSADASLPVHDVTIEPGSRLAEILGSEPLAVNSRHHQAVATPGDGLSVTARSAGDAVVEALERRDRRFAVAVQWHPEDQTRETRHRRLFEALAASL